ncbi:hypothetical protein Rcae01_01049 [Novipirellula caenicola]|uniref:Pyridoxamine 5'-phosphate oxidase putative domain-containing protein n=1 Tax=Novipirellula caenicola TaxID=1536901 RepID=A0ABP9VK75_9BACT
MRADVENRCLVYQRPDGVDKSRYHSNGTVAITILTEGQPPVAPLMYWTIDSDGYLLVATSDDMADARRVRLRKRMGESLVVQRDDGTSYNLAYSD